MLHYNWSMRCMVLTYMVHILYYLDWGGGGGAPTNPQCPPPPHPRSSSHTYSIDVLHGFHYAITLPPH